MKKPAQKTRAPRLTHLDARGRARMVDVGMKPATEREAVAEAIVRMKPATLKLATAGKAKKGDVLAVARVAGIQAAKKTSELIPLCHQVPLSSVQVEFEAKSGGTLHVRATARCAAQTGVEMEALAAAAIAALTVYDMLKAAERGMRIESLGLLRKSGGRSGTWTRGAR
ncbi:MAG: cyclic pyranopterin monophosphate synthase MoaC [Planctomycetota bacterium]|nr:cyclic pyranopterin monophosphate synthase MoaC [Planctomycetota bacterium]